MDTLYEALPELSRFQTPSINIDELLQAWLGVPPPYYEFVVATILLNLLIEIVLDIRQLIAYRNAKGVPVELKGDVKPEDFKKSVAYGSEKLRFGLFSTVFNTAHTLVQLHFAVLPFIWHRTLVFMQQYDYDESYEITHSLLFLGVYQLYSDIIQLPFSLYSTFVIEEKYGFNKQTLKLFFIDMLKSLALTVALGVPIMVGLLRLMQWGGSNLWLYMWLFVLGVSLVMVTIYPTVIQPLFNKFTPLEEGELRTSIENLAKKIDFPLTKLYVVDGSTRSAHSNAYFYGFFKNKRIVIYDTLLNDVDNAGVLAIIGHELGHYHFSHNLKNLVIAQLHIMLFFFIVGLCLNSTLLFRSFGFDSSSHLIGLLLASSLYGPVEHIFSLLMHALARRFEYQADKFAFDQGLSLERPLIKIHTSNLGNLCPDPWYSAYHFSHPTLTERLRALQSYRKKTG